MLSIWYIVYYLVLNNMASLSSVKLLVGVTLQLKHLIEINQISYRLN